MEAEHPVSAYKIPRMTWRSVNNPRNSASSGVPFSWLDWSNWWTDGGERGLYIHVHGVKDHPEDAAYGMSECVYRVYPRERKGFRCTRLAVRDGELGWLYDEVRANA
jgi:hypothetical protein